MISKCFHAGIVALGITLFSYSALMAQATTMSDDVSFSHKQWFHQIESGFISGNEDIGEGTSLSLAVVNGLRISDHMAVGVGAGWDRYDRLNVFPVFARTIGLLKPEGHTPYAFLDLGYAWVHERNLPDYIEVERMEGGLMFQSGLGYMFEGNGWRINIFAGLKIQKTKLEYLFEDQWWYSSPMFSEERTRKRFSAGLSFLF